MTDANYTQKRMQEIQSSGDFASTFGKLISGKSGYKPVIEKKMVIVQCKGCSKIIEDDSVKFCPECGTKIERPAR